MSNDLVLSLGSGLQPSQGQPPPRIIRYAWDASPSMEPLVPHFVPLIERSLEAVRALSDPKLLIGQTFFGNPENIHPFPNQGTWVPVPASEIVVPSIELYNAKIQQNRSTALRDAIVTTIRKAFEHEQPGFQDMIIAITDGLENSSQISTGEGREAVRKALDAGKLVALIGFVHEREEVELLRFADSMGIPRELVSVNVHQGDAQSVAASMAHTAHTMTTTSTGFFRPQNHQN